MQVTIGARCFDGYRRKTLPPMIKVEGLKTIEHKDTIWDKVNRVAARFNDPKVLAVCTYAVPIILLASGLPPLGLSHALAHTASVFIPGGEEAITAMAAAANTQETIMHAFDPLIHLIKNLAYPIAGVMIAGGCLFIMVGNREAGMKMLTNAALGYVLVQLSPLLLKLLVGVGAGV